jgi:hypothetical protein
MDYFAGLDISMDETHVCVLDLKAWWFARARRSRLRRRSPTNWPKRQGLCHSNGSASRFAG